jgi:hypothetical protein
VIHIIYSLTILLFLSSLITVFYSDTIIKFYKLEEKYPRLAKFIQLRRKFQQYYFFFNSLGIIIFALIILIFNFWIFFNVNL